MLLYLRAVSKNVHRNVDCSAAKPTFRVKVAIIHRLSSSLGEPPLSLSHTSQTFCDVISFREEGFMCSLLKLFFYFFGRVFSFSLSFSLLLVNIRCTFLSLCNFCSIACLFLYFAHFLYSVFISSSPFRFPFCSLFF
jgi:hypothetical protein